MTRTLPLFLARRLAFAMSAGSLIALLSACSSSTPLFLSDGRPTVQVQCAAGGDHDSCMQQARARCNGPFDTVATSQTDAGYNLVFACRAP